MQIYRGLSCWSPVSQGPLWPLWPQKEEGQQIQSWTRHWSWLSRHWWTEERGQARGMSWMAKSKKTKERHLVLPPESFPSTLLSPYLFLDGFGNDFFSVATLDFGNIVFVQDGLWTGKNELCGPEWLEYNQAWVWKQFDTSGYMATLFPQLNPLKSPVNESRGLNKRTGPVSQCGVPWALQCRPFERELDRAYQDDPVGRGKLIELSEMAIEGTQGGDILVHSNSST